AETSRTDDTGNLEKIRYARPTRKPAHLDESVCVFICPLNNSKQQGHSGQQFRRGGNLTERVFKRTVSCEVYGR
ncbi:hypothetical protein BaRGS_00000271, partial [Batillaria attramentaria]